MTAESIDTVYGLWAEDVQYSGFDELEYVKESIGGVRTETSISGIDITTLNE